MYLLFRKTYYYLVHRNTTENSSKALKLKQKRQQKNISLDLKTHTYSTLM